MDRLRCLYCLVEVGVVYPASLVVDLLAVGDINSGDDALLSAHKVLISVMGGDAKISASSESVDSDLGRTLFEEVGGVVNPPNSGVDLFPVAVVAGEADPNSGGDANISAHSVLASVMVGDAKTSMG